MINIATIGTNFIVDDFMDGALHTPGLTVLGACSRTQANAQRLADKYGIQKTYTSLDDLAADPDIHAVYIATPNSCHKPQAVQMLKSGKHVLLEKPAVSCRKDFDQILEAAKESGCIVMEAMRPVHGPAIEQIRKLIPRLGPVRRVSFFSGKYSSRYTAFRSGEIQNAFNPALENSALMDMGVYAVEMLMALFGPPQEMHSLGTKLHNGFEGQGSVICQYDGMIADVTYSKISDSYTQSEIQGEDGSLLIDSLVTPQTLTLCPRGGEREVYAAVSGRHPMQFEAQDFCAAIRGELDPSPFTAYTAHTVAFIEQVCKNNGVRFV
ncbi:MAG: Gfo/Idh/MocA family oxidoreductase [Clostridia bacterium]|nr:Gfo/Idh/MocA family oxidoreductase [Clostridia bacterium]